MLTDKQATSTVLSEQAVDSLLEATTSATAQMAHDAAVEAARDGECATAEDYQPLPYRATGSEHSDPWASEESPDGFAEQMVSMLD